MTDHKALTRRMHKLHDRISKVEHALGDLTDDEIPALRLELGRIAIGVMHIMTDLDGPQHEGHQSLQELFSEEEETRANTND